MPIRGSPYRAQELIVERRHLRNYNSRKQVRMKISTGTEARSAYLGCLRKVAEPTAETRQDLYPLTRAISPDSASLLNSTETRQHDERRAAEDRIWRGQIRKELEVRGLRKRSLPKGTRFYDDLAENARMWRSR